MGWFALAGRTGESETGEKFAVLVFIEPGALDVEEIEAGLRSGDLQAQA